MKRCTNQLFIMITVVSAILFTGCGPTSISLNNDAVAHLEVNEVSEAESLLQQSLNLNFENPQTHLYLGQCFKQQGRYEKAIYEYRLAVKFRPSFLPAQMALIKTLSEDGQPVASTVQAKNFLEFKTDSVDSLIEIGNTFAEQKLHEQALIAYKQAHNINPNSAAGTVALGDYYFSIGQNEAGLQCYKDAFVIDPIFPGLSRKLGEQGMKVDFSDQLEEIKSPEETQQQQ